MPKFMRVGAFLRSHRESMDLTQAEYGEKFGVSENQFVSNWERGLCMPPAHAMKKLLKVFTRAEQDALREALGQDLVDHYWKRYLRGSL